MPFGIPPSSASATSVHMGYFAQDLEINQYDSCSLQSCSSTTESFSDEESHVVKLLNKPKKHVTFPDPSKLECVLEIPNRQCMLEEYREGDSDSNSDSSELEEEFEKLSVDSKSSVRHSVLRQFGTYPGIIGKPQSQLYQKQSTAICTLARRNTVKNQQNGTIKSYTTIAKLQSDTCEQEFPDNLENIHENNKTLKDQSKKITSSKVTRQYKVSRPNSSPAVLRVKIKRPDLCAAGSLMQSKTELKPPVVKGSALGITITKPVHASSGIPRSRSRNRAAHVPTFSVLPRLFSSLNHKRSTSMQLAPQIYSVDTSQHNSNVQMKNSKNMSTSSAFKRNNTFVEMSQSYGLPLTFGDKPTASQYRNAYTYSIANITKLDKDHQMLPMSYGVPSQRKHAWQTANGFPTSDDLATPCITPLFDDKILTAHFTSL